MRLPDYFLCHIITLSDRASKGAYEDLSGPKIHGYLTTFFLNWGKEHSIERSVLPDDPMKLKKHFLRIAGNSHLIITTGGTGIGPRDITVDVLRPLLDKEIPGIMEAIRIRYGMNKPNALLSRSLAGVRGNSLVFALPGSVKAVNEYMTEILKSLEHAYYMLYGVDRH